MKFINLIKHNYKTNFWGYVLVWILLLIPIPFCIIQTIKFYNWNGDIEFFKRVKCHHEEREWIEHWVGQDFEEYFSPLVKDPQLILLFFILSIVVITAVIILSSRNNKDFKYRRLYITLSLLLYFAIICAILSWYSNVTIMINNGCPETVWPTLTYTLIVLFVITGIYLGVSYIFCRIISWFYCKRKILFMILSTLILSPIWIFISFVLLVGVASSF